MSLFRDFRTERRIAQMLAIKQTSSVEGVQALQKLRECAGEAIPRLVRLLASGEGVNKAQLVQILTRLLDDDTLPHFHRVLAAGDPRLAQAAVEILRGGRGYDPNHLLDFLADPAVPKATLLDILSAQGKLLDAAGILRQISYLDPSERNVAFRLLSEIAEPSLIPELVSRANAKDLQIRQGVARVLGRFDHPMAHEALRHLLDDPGKTVRQLALEALAAHSGALDIETLFRLLRDSDLSIQGRAVDAIIQMRDPETLTYLIDVLRDESEYVRRAGVEILNETGDTTSIKTLLRAIRDDDWWVRARAADALARIGGSRVIQAVVSLLRDEDEFIRRAAVEIMNSIKDEASFRHLIDALADSDWWVRERAVDALAKLGNKAAVPALLPLLERDDATAVAVLRALMRLGGPEQIGVVSALLNRPEPSVRSEAMLVLVELADAERATAIHGLLDKAARAAPEDEVRDLARDCATRLGERFAAPGAAAESYARISAGDEADADESESEVPVIDGPPIKLKLLRAGELLGERYRHIRRIGRGAFGTVTLAEDLVRGEQVILKFLHPQMAVDDNMVRRFQREHHFAKRIEHRNVIRIYDFFMLGGLYVISMEYFPSTALSAEVKAHVPLSLERGLHIAHEVAAGMTAAHAIGIVHRDLKPGNILTNEHNLVKIVDFGVAAAVDSADTRLTRTGLLVGTPRYMAPEQVLGKSIDARTDIYSLGVILYEMLAGASPYSGEDNVAVMYQHVQGGATPLHERNPDISRTLSAFVTRMMAVEPDKRFRSMSEVRRTLEPFMHDHRL